jgi:hypothetical protein
LLSSRGVRNNVPCRTVMSWILIGHQTW